MNDETTHIATAAALLDDRYAALSQHLHGDGDKCASYGCTNHAVIRACRWRLCRYCYEKMELSA